jgi:hypothetical protein
MRKKKQTVFLISSVLLILFFLSEILIAQNQMPISVLSNGGEEQSNADYIIVGTVGQTSIDKFSGSSYIIQSGFWNEYPIATPVEEEEMLPIVYKLEQNYPNPFNPTTIIKYAVPERSNVLIKIYDVLGSEVVTLVNEEMDAGWYQKVFDASGYASAMYIYRMQAGNYISTKKMLLIK